MNPQIFLDFNGVLDSSRGHYGGINFDPECVKAFNTIAEKFTPDIIIISTWRLSYSQEELQNILTRNKMLGTVIGKTPEIWEAGSTRGNEIENWKEQQASPGAPMLILEDCANVDPYEKYCVRPKPYVGLSMTDVPQAITILNAQL